MSKLSNFLGNSLLDPQVDITRRELEVQVYLSIIQDKLYHNTSIGGIEYLEQVITAINSISTGINQHKIQYTKQAEKDFIKHTADRIFLDNIMTQFFQYKDIKDETTSS